MLIRDKHIDPSAKFHNRVLPIALTIATGLTDAVIHLVKAPFDFKILRAAIYARLYTATASIRVVLSKAEGIVVKCTSLAIATTVTSFRTNGTLTYLAGGLVKTKAATDNIAFTAAHATSAANKWMAILVQIDAAGAVSTKVSAATQAFDTEAAAIAALPTADALKVAIGYITVMNTAAAFTCNTTALNAGTVTDNYYVYAERLAFAAANPIAGQEVVPALSATAVDTEIEDDEYLVVLCTSDGTGALTNATLNLNVRPHNLRGDTA